jgi:hypothetical protein
MTTFGAISRFYVGAEKGLNELLRIQPPPAFLSIFRNRLYLPSAGIGLSTEAIGARTDARLHC